MDLKLTKNGSRKTMHNQGKDSDKYFFDWLMPFREFVEPPLPYRTVNCNDEKLGQRTSTSIMPLTCHLKLLVCCPLSVNSDFASLCFLFRFITHS